MVGLVSLFLCLLAGLLKHFSRGGTWPKISCHIFTDRYLIEIWGGGGKGGGLMSYCFQENITN